MRRLVVACLGVAVLAGSVAEAVPAPHDGPYALWAEVREVYAGLAAYRDAGTLEVVAPDGGGRRYRFATTVAEGGRFRLEVREVGVETPWRRVLWRDAEGGWFLLAAAGDDPGRYHPVGSPAAGLAGLLRLEGGLGLDALMIPALILDGDGARGRPGAAAADPPEPCACGAATCRRLTLSWPADGLQAELLVDAESGLVRHLDVAAAAAAALLGLGTGTDPEPALGGAGSWRLRADFVESTAGDEGATSLAATARFAPPPGAELVAAEEAGQAPVSPEAAFGETVDVRLVSTTVRVLRPDGHPLHGLGAEDFRVRVAGRPVSVRSADEWLPDAPPPPDGPSAATGVEGPGANRAGAPSPPTPPLVVVFVQADFHAVRIRGHLAALNMIESFLAGLPREVPVAVVSMDSHAKLWLDFSHDRDAAWEAVWRAVRFGGEPPAFRERDRRGPLSLAAGFDFHEARRTTGPDRALELVARALAPLPGEKSVVFLGWGVGRRAASAPRHGGSYATALAWLRHASASVFVLDVTQADWHSLEAGLRRIADDSGGTFDYVRDVAREDLARLAAVAASYYVLYLDAADLPPAGGRVEVELAGRRGRVLVQRGTLLRQAAGG
jgi:hypothetical protein